MKEADLIECILKTWPYHRIRPRYVVGVQVRDAAGYSARRMLDAVVFDTWPSGGLVLHGLEIKTSPSDFRREIQNPAKAGHFLEILDRFSIVAPLGVVDLNILPKKWGLYCPTDDGTLRARRKPLPLRPGEPIPKTIDRSFSAALVRAIMERTIDHSLMTDEYERGRAAGIKDREREVENANRRVQSIENAVKYFEEKSGIAFNTYQGGSIGNAVKFVMSGGLKRQIHRSTDLRDLGTRLIKLADELEDLSEDMEMEN